MSETSHTIGLRCAGRSRLEYITEVTPVVKQLPSWLWHKEDMASIKKRLEKALEKNKEDAEADPVRESEERTKKELADAKLELEAKMAALAETQQTILKLLQEKPKTGFFQS